MPPAIRASPARPPTTAPAIWPPDTREPPDADEDESSEDGAEVTVWVTTDPPTVTTVTWVTWLEVRVDEELDSSEELDELDDVVAADELVDDSDFDVDEVFWRRIVSSCRQPERSATVRGHKIPHTGKTVETTTDADWVTVWTTVSVSGTRMVVSTELGAGAELCTKRKLKMTFLRKRQTSKEAKK